MHLKRKLKGIREQLQNSATNTVQPLQAGTTAPDFILPSTTGSPIKLSDLHGRPIILTFYPADNSPVCSNQLALYNQALPMFEQHDAVLLGISIDDLQSHQGFANNLNLNFPLLADNNPKGAVARTYGVYDESANNASRALFVIDKNGRISWQHVSPANINPGANGILVALEALD